MVDQRRRRRWAAIAFGALMGTGVLADGAISPVGAQSAPVTSEAPVAYAVNEDVGRIERLYLTVLGRFPDVDGLTYWMDLYQQGVSYDAILAEFMASPERQARFGPSVSDEVFLTNLYRDALERDPDPDGRAYWLAQLGRGYPRTEIVKLFADSPEQRARTTPVGDFNLNILHINDHHSHLEAAGATLNLAGQPTDVEIGGFSRVVTKFNELVAKHDGEAVAKLHAGDAITGTLYYSLFKGEADAAMMNEICFDAFALGNHEFDGGDAELAQFLDFLASDPDCHTPVLAANVEPRVGTPLAMSGPNEYLRPWIVRPYGDGQYVAFIGLDIASKTKNSSSPYATTQFLDEAATAQRYIDDLSRVGIDKIVLLTHYQYDNDLALAKQLRGVDVIIGGDSHSLLGDFSAEGLSSSGPYPTMTTNAQGLPVCVAQAWQYSAVVGELNIEFDQYGHVASCGGTPHLLLGDTFIRDEEELDDTARNAVLNFINSRPNLSIVEPDAAAEAVLAEYAAQVEVLQQQIIGNAAEPLCLSRIPGDGRSTIEGCQAKTAVTGGQVQQLVTDGFLARSFEADIALQNAGGVRVDIQAGPFSIADAYEVLPFANTMVNMQMTGAQIRATIEEGVQNAIRPEGSTGAYPVAAGLRWDMDLSQPEGQRASNIEVRRRGSDQWTPLDLTATYTVVTNSFMAGGGDGFTTMGSIYGAGRYVDTGIDYAQGLIDYIERDLGGTIPVPTEYSTKSFIPAN